MLEVLARKVAHLVQGLMRKRKRCKSCLLFNRKMLSSSKWKGILVLLKVLWWKSKLLPYRPGSGLLRSLPICVLFCVPIRLMNSTKTPWKGTSDREKSGDIGGTEEPEKQKTKSKKKWTKNESEVQRCVRAYQSEKEQQEKYSGLEQSHRGVELAASSPRHTGNFKAGRSKSTLTVSASMLRHRCPGCLADKTGPLSVAHCTNDCASLSAAKENEK